MKSQCFVVCFIYFYISYAVNIKGVTGQKSKYDIRKFGWNDAEFYSNFNKNLKWPNATIWYDIDPHLTEEMLEAVYSAVEYINSLEEICVTWRQRPPISEGWVSNHWVSFVHYHDDPSSGHCSADLGRSTDGRSYINIGTHCAIFWYSDNKVFLKYAVLHEMMHTMGLRHEHQRPDRDCYLYMQSTVEGFMESGSLAGLPGSDFPSGFPYDLNSIMQYVRRPDGSLRAHDYRWYDIGRTDGKLSPLDIYKLDHLYCGAPRWCETVNSPNFCDHMYDFAASEAKCWREGDAYTRSQHYYYYYYLPAPWKSYVPVI